MEDLRALSIQVQMSFSVEQQLRPTMKKHCAGQGAELVHGVRELKKQWAESPTHKGLKGVPLV